MAKAARKKENEQEDGRQAPENTGGKKGFSLKNARKAWEELLRRKRENEEALRQYRKDHKRKEENE